MTHTYAILDVSPAAYKEIHDKLQDAGYSNQFYGGERSREVIDMHGIAVREERSPMSDEMAKAQMVTTPPGPPVHPASMQVLRYFEYSHLPDHLQEISRQFHTLAWDMVARLPQNPEVAVGLRKLLEAKDCFVRARLP